MMADAQYVELSIMVEQVRKMSHEVESVQELKDRIAEMCVECLFMNRPKCEVCHPPTSNQLELNFNS